MTAKDIIDQVIGKTEGEYRLTMVQMQDVICMLAKAVGNVEDRLDIQEKAMSKLMAVLGDNQSK